MSCDLQESLSQRIARGYKEEDDENAGRVSSRAEGYRQLEQGHWQWAPWLQRSCVWPTEALVALLTSAVDSCGCSGVTSIGCGTGLLEWFVAESMAPMSVRGFDTRPLELQLLPEAARSIAYGQLPSSQTVVRVPSDDALLISWGELSPAVWSAYLLSYVTNQGRCLILIVDHSDTRCTPRIRDVESALSTADPTSPWYPLLDRFPFGNKLGPYTCADPCLVSIFARR